MNELQAPLYEDKVIDFLIEMADVTDEVVSAEELMRSPDDTEAEAEQAAKTKPATKKKASGTAKPEAKAKSKTVAKTVQNRIKPDKTVQNRAKTALNRIKPHKTVQNLTNRTDNLGRSNAGRFG